MSLKEALAGVKQGQSEPKQELQNRELLRPEKPVTARTPGKSSSSEYERLTVYILKTTKRDSGRKWEDATGKDMSDLVELLLSKYLND